MHLWRGVGEPPALDAMESDRERAFVRAASGGASVAYLAGRIEAERTAAALWRSALWSVSQVATWARCSRGAARRMLKRLEKRGVVERHR